MCNCDLKILHFMSDEILYTPVLNHGLEKKYREGHLESTFFLYKANHRGEVQRHLVMREDLIVITNKNRDSYVEFLI